MGTLYSDKFYRKCPPRDTGPAGTAIDAPTAPGVRVIAANNATTSFELDNDLFQFTPPANTPGSPGGWGEALFQIQNEDASNAVYILFGSASTVAANSAATSGNTMCDLLRGGQDVTYAINPQTLDKFVSIRTKNGVTGTATVRVRIVSYRNQTGPGSG